MRSLQKKDIEGKEIQDSETFNCWANMLTKLFVQPTKEILALSEK